MADPFELEHNLTKGVRDVAAVAILDRVRISLPRLKTACPPDQDALQYYFAPAYVHAFRVKCDGPRTAAGRWSPYRRPTASPVTGYCPFTAHLRMI